MPQKKSFLNKEQERAVQEIKGPLLIIAGAGTGKTTMIVEKIKYIIEKKLATPDQILALTFTEKAAQEMEERVDEAVPYGYFQMHISTFHAFADEILRQEAGHIGLDPGYRLMTTAENILFLRSHLFAFDLLYFRPLGNPTKFLDDLLNHFSRLRDEDVSPQEYLTYAKKLQKQKRVETEEKKKVMELAKAYHTYQRLKIKEGRMDFADLIYYAVQLFKTRKNILARYQQKFKYILVDEFQDTNIAQYILLKLLRPPKEKGALTVVGDDSQAIYKFRGASVSNILTFMKDYKNAKQVTLRQNYRSNQQILDAAYSLIQFNNPDTLEAQLGISKNLIAARKPEPTRLRRNEVTGKPRRLNESEVGNEPVSFNLFDTADHEAEFIAKEILKLKDTYKFSDIAILARANAHLHGLTRALSLHGIPYQFHGPSLLFKQEEVRDLIAYINVLVDLSDSISLYRVLNMDIFKLDELDLNLLVSFARKVNLTLFQAIEVVSAMLNKRLERTSFKQYQKYIPDVSKKSKATLLKIFLMIQKHLKLVRRETAGQILYYFLEDTGYLPLLVNYETTKTERRAMNLSKFFSRLKAYEAEAQDATVAAVADFIKMNEELGDSPAAVELDRTRFDAVNLLTIHGAKGLEFPVVFVVNMVNGRLPTYERAERIPIPDELIKEILPKGDYHLQEERRLFYVALTRAEDKAFLTASAFYGEGKRERKVSPFVLETLGEEYIRKTKNVIEEERSQLSIFEYKKKPEVLIATNQKLNTFSYSQLETFLTCPLQYKLKYILRLPAPQTGQESLGVSVHTALEEFYKLYNQGEKPKLSHLLELYEDAWIPVGYSSAAHQLKMKREGQKMLESYFKKQHNNKLDILSLEQPFKIKISDFTLVGKIDRMDRKDGKVEIIDYKTGRQHDDKKIQNSLQMAIYFLAATDKGLYGKKPEDVTMSFYFLQTGAKVSVTKTKEDISKIKEQLTKIVQRIRTSKFPAKKGQHCNFCPYRDICCYREG